MPRSPDNQALIRVICLIGQSVDLDGRRFAFVLVSLKIRKLDYSKDKLNVVR
jgi:hypothetical protein